MSFNGSTSTEGDKQSPCQPDPCAGTATIDAAQSVPSWWSRPCGPRDVVVLALPLIISTMSWTVMNFIDRMYLLWYSTEAMAAALPAGILHYTMICFPLGLASYVNTFVAQYEGAGRPDRIGASVWQGIWIGIACTPLFLAVVPLTPALFHPTGHNPSLMALEITYFQVLALGGGAGIIAAAQATFFTGRGKTSVVMLVDCTGAVVNIILDYAWIFGHWGFPAAGIEGAAWATVVGQWTRVLFYFLLMETTHNRRTYHFRAGRRLQFDLLRRLLRFGGPNGLQYFVEVAAFSFFLLVMGRLGEQALAATTLAFNINSIAFVPMLGLGLAVSTMVGQQLGRDRPDLAARATWTSVWIAFAYTGIMALFYILAPDLLMMGHAAGTAPQQFAPLRNMTVVLLRFVAAYCLFDAMNIIFVSAIKGAGDTRFVLRVTLLMSPLPVAFVWLGIRHFGLGLIWCWLVLTMWICALGLIYLGRFLEGRWRHMRVIEPHLAPELDAGIVMSQLAEGLRVDPPTVGGLILEQPHSTPADEDQLAAQPDP